MRTYVGCIIRESLTTEAPLEGWTPFTERVAHMPDDPDATTWHVGWFWAEEGELQRRLPELAAAMRPHWYAHFWEGDDLCVILAQKAFWAKISDRSTWAPFIAYGDTVGVERKWTESIPTQLPEWVKASL